MSMNTPTAPDLLSVHPPIKKRRRNLSNESQSGSTYDAAYNALKKLNNMTLPLSMNRITTNGNIKVFLVKNGLIKEVSPEHNLREEYLTYSYYSINTKGQDYIKRYESFKELLTYQNGLQRQM